jgi:hypothetical protein
MAAVFFYAIVLTVGVVFLLALAPDEISGFARTIVDLLH